MQHHFKAGRTVSVAGLDSVDDIHQDTAGSMTQIQTEGDDDKPGQRKAPGDDDTFMLCQYAERMAGDFINHEPVGVGERVVVIPGAATFIENFALTSRHAAQDLGGNNLLEELAVVRVQ